MSKIIDYEIINHGYEHSQYFQGCGTAFTKYDECVTGAAHTAKEAYEDAREQIACAGVELEGLPKRPKGIRARDHVPASHSGENSEFYWYVSIRYNKV